MDKDDEFWTAYIATTPEQDKQFGGGKFLLLVVCVGVLAALAMIFSHH